MKNDVVVQWAVVVAVAVKGRHMLFMLGVVIVVGRGEVAVVGC